MNEFVTWIGQNSTLVKTAGSAVIGLAALAFASLQIIKAMKHFGADKMKEGGKAIGLAILIIVIAAVGITGVISIANTLRPDTLNGSTDFSSAISYIDSGVYNLG